eukprot:9345700-Alexandrium_andersonii.AAC.1
MTSLGAKLMVGRTSCPSPKAPAESTPAPKAKHMPAAKFPPTEANFVDSPYPSGGQPVNLPK